MDAIANIAARPGSVVADRPIRLLNAGLNELPSGEIVAHGWLDIDSMKALLVDDYQREVLGAEASGKKSSLRRAIETGAHLPDIVIGMRGENYEVSRGSSAMTLLDKCYIIDGLQRISALLFDSERNPDGAKNLRIGAEVRFNTTKDTEKDLFLTLNTSRIPVSPNVILRGLRDKHPGILTLYGLSHSDAKFALYRRVCWNQRMARSDLVTALMVAKVAGALHTTSGAVRSERAVPLASQIDEKAKKIGLSIFRRNVVAFFEVVDECFGIRNVTFKAVSPQLKTNFLLALAKVFASYEDFWDGDALHLDATTKKKLALFPINDPEIVRLAGSGTMTLPMLVQYLVEHLDKGKKLHRLKKRGS